MLNHIATYPSYTDHVKKEIRGIPILIAIYNKEGITACHHSIQNAMERGALQKVDGKLPFHIICDESDLVSRSVEAYRFSRNSRDCFLFNWWCSGIRSQQVHSLLAS